MLVLALRRVLALTTAMMLMGAGLLAGAATASSHPPAPCDPAMDPTCGGAPPADGSPHVEIGFFCVELTCGFSAQVFPEDTVLDSTDWDFGDSSPHVTNDPGPGHTYAAPGDYTVTLHWVHAAHSGDATAWVTVPMDPSAGPDPYPAPGDVFAMPSCLDLTCLFDFYTELSLTKATWNFDDGSAAAEVNLAGDHVVKHVYTAPGLYHAVLSWTTASDAGETDAWVSVPQDGYVKIFPFCDGFFCSFGIDTNYPDADSFAWDFDANGVVDLTGTPADCQEEEPTGDAPPPPPPGMSPPPPESPPPPPPNDPCFPAHAFPEVEGDYIVWLTLVPKDHAGNKLPAMKTEVVVHLPFEFVFPGHDFDDVFVEATCYEYDCWFYAWGLPVDEYSWDFGDGETRTGLDAECDEGPPMEAAPDEHYDGTVCSPAHLYAAEGEYLVTLDWVSGERSGSSTMQVNVPDTTPDYSYAPPSEFNGGTVRGRVLDAANNKPVQGLGVNLWSDDADPDESNNLWLGGYGETDADGVFVITGLENGVYDVYVATWETPFLPFEGEDWVTVAGATDGAELKVDVDQAIKLGRGVPFSGWVQEKGSGAAIPGADVSLWAFWFGPECKGVLDAENPGWGDLVCDYPEGNYDDADHMPGPGAAALVGADCPPGAPCIQSDGGYQPYAIACDEATEFCYSELEAMDAGYGYATADEQGAFDVPHLTPGLYGMGVWPPEGSELPSWTSGYDEFLILDADGWEGLVVQLGGSAKVTARLLAGGEPAPDAYVSVWPADDATWDSCDASCDFWDATNDLGKVSFWDVPAGKWELHAQPPYMAGKWEQDELTGSWEYTEYSGPELAPVTKVFDHAGGNLDLGDLAFPTARTLTGKITDSSGAPIAAAVSIWSENSPIGGWAETTDGKYEIERMVPGTYDVSIWRVGDSSWSTDHYVFLDDQVIGEDMVFNYQFKVLGILTGTVTGSAPVPGAGISVWCEDCDGGGYAITGDDGKFRMSGLPTGTYSLWAWKDGSDYLPKYITDILVKEGETTTRDFAFSGGVALSGKVCSTAACGTPISNADIWVWSPDGWGDARSGADGAFSITGLGPGTYEAYVAGPTSSCDADGCQKVYQDLYVAELVVPDTGLTGHVFVLGSPVTMTGLATLNGAPCGACWLYVASDTLHLYGGDQTSANGAFAIPGMAAGEFRIEGYDAEGSYLGVVECTVGANGQGCSPAFTTTGLKQVDVTVKTGAGAAVKDALVLIVSGTDVVAKDVTGESGKVSFKLGNGEYKVIVSKGALTTSSALSITDGTTSPAAHAVTLG